MRPASTRACSCPAKGVVCADGLAQIDPGHWYPSDAAFGATTNLYHCLHPTEASPTDRPSRASKGTVGSCAAIARMVHAQTDAGACLVRAHVKPCGSPRGAVAVVLRVLTSIFVIPEMLRWPRWKLLLLSLSLSLVCFFDPRFFDFSSHAIEMNR